MTLLKETPENVKELVKNAGCKHNWKQRLSALEVLRKYDCPQSRDVITRLALHDKVYKVKKVAFEAAQALGIKKNDKPIRLGRKNTGYKPKDFTKLFLRIKREKEMDVLDLCLFTIAFGIRKGVRSLIYDKIINQRPDPFVLLVKV